LFSLDSLQSDEQEQVINLLPQLFEHVSVLGGGVIWQISSKSGQQSLPSFLHLFRQSHCPKVLYWSHYPTHDLTAGGEILQ